MTKPGKQELDLIHRTLDNLDYIDRDIRAQLQEEVFEVTQLVNAFLGVLAHPWEKLFDPGSLSAIELGSDEYDELGFPSIQSSWEQDSEHPQNLAHLFRLLRNGVAHGNIDLMDRRELHRKFDKEPPKVIENSEIAGAEIWNNKDEKCTKKWSGPAGVKHYRIPYRSWGTVLTIDEMRQFLDAVANLSRLERLHRTSTLLREGGRRTQEEAKAELNQQIIRDRNKYAPQKEKRIRGR